MGITLVELSKLEAAFVCFERFRRSALMSEAALRIGTALQALGRPANAYSAFIDAPALGIGR